MQVLTVDYRASNAPALFCQSLKETGFVVLKNHPISPQLINDTYAEWQRFFNTENKTSYLYQKPKQDGYFPFGTENAKESTVYDLKEFYHFYPWGKQPPETAELSLVMFNELTSLAKELLQWVEEGLPQDVAANLSTPLRDMIQDAPNTLLRILHYPPIKGEVMKGAVRAAAHEDINLITLLPTATAPGLEVKDVHGNWHQIPCDPGSIAINAADMLQECTEYYYRSTTHRVVNPEGAMKNVSRYSMPLFLHPREDVRLSAKYTAGEYLAQRLKEIGIY